ncbi:hypothetical protein RRF57_011809 [Xylaria bambusicola]|uniref:Uncharacterized protein n=1 Tax=Xylaria bambusicola TaxID=326684 RepID=A0AAN7ZA91_9PEZI
MESIALVHHAAKPAAPYTRQTPNLPPVIPPPTNWTTPMKIVPSYDNVDPSSLSKEDLAIITQNGLEQVAQDSAAHWTYESRRVAQPILDYLYLGPSNVLKNRKWLQDEGVTMILAARDSKQAGGTSWPSTSWRKRWGSKLVI